MKNKSSNPGKKSDLNKKGSISSPGKSTGTSHHLSDADRKKGGQTSRK
ncbi:hypothetical protein OQJ18_01445 [Fluoribacter dumoffii]|uniref:Uncharacterized protein n=1 Tax=Fluoribacter dumoffii TaxID=463 RepID=A0A377GBI6_9GAMM|nr:hypothetical protein [Fluoribacter dumoffii]MCW8386166.1 hypothetical protein [Fluoribacter dumoffii]MCW8419217.1 hypothetical protein [Fluoribacter dumoffii]MCW8452908.1 hypothetical protein [Fluoribacter dumoffii]MCW8459842.1 hypothetical protein [Fluoribacter dumoffii]MCW8483319.1 hypothetical protein [Fluoribacter dumoffii]